MTRAATLFAAARDAPDIAIVGGGASGALIAAHLLRDRQHRARVTLIEPGADLGRGLAYSTRNPHHLLNVRAQNMSAFADDPDHFWRWLQAQDPIGEDRFRFVPRALYGRYLGGLLDPYLDPAADGRLSLLRDRATRLVRTDGFEIELASGGKARADVVALACGHETIAPGDPLYISPWEEPPAGAPPDAAILILGAGLTMVDVALALRDGGHRGRIVAVSRRGLAPQAHRRGAAAALDVAQRPHGARLADLCRWLRAAVEDERRRGGDWRGVIDALRPHVQAIWSEMPLAARRRFLEHARPWWDTHRHRMAPEVAARLGAMTADGTLEIVAGKVVEIVPGRDGARVAIRRRGGDRLLSLDVWRIVSCRGVVKDPRDSADPFVGALLADGLARADPLGIGLDVAADCAIIDGAGRASDRLFAVGPMSQAAFWEIIAIPDIRLQAAALAPRLLRMAPVSAPAQTVSAGRPF